MPNPDASHGYCTDDVARLLIVVAASGVRAGPGRVERMRLQVPRRLAGRDRARTETGAMSTVVGTARAGSSDCWGRSAVGVRHDRSARARDEGMRSSALSYFGHAVNQRSPQPRAMAFAALGAAEVLAAGHRHDRAPRSAGRRGHVHRTAGADRALAVAGAETLVRQRRYAGGADRRRSLLGRPEAVEDGLHAAALAARSRDRGRAPVADAGRWGRTGRSGARVRSTADRGGGDGGRMCPSHSVTGDAAWRDGLELAVNWFAGDNDGGSVMWDPAHQWRLRRADRRRVRTSTRVRSRRSR